MHLFSWKFGDGGTNKWEASYICFIVQYKLSSNTLFTWMKINFLWFQLRHEKRYFLLPPINIHYKAFIFIYVSSVLLHCKIKYNSLCWKIFMESLALTLMLNLSTFATPTKNFLNDIWQNGKTIGARHFHY